MYRGREFIKIFSNKKTIISGNNAFVRICDPDGFFDSIWIINNFLICKEVVVETKGCNVEYFWIEDECNGIWFIWNAATEKEWAYKLMKSKKGKTEKVAKPTSGKIEMKAAAWNGWKTK